MQAGCGRLRGADEEGLGVGDGKVSSADERSRVAGRGRVLREADVATGLVMGVRGAG